MITQQPANRTVGAGADVTLSVGAVGSAPLSYQWLRSETNLPGKTSASLLFANVQPEASGIYSVLVTNAYGSLLSSNAILTVTNTAPSIVTQPGGDPKLTNISRLIPVGGNTSLSVSARGSSPIQYQWRLNGTDLPGATNATLGLTNMSYEQTGYYSVAVRNAFGEIVSAKVFLNVVQVYVWGESATSPASPNTPTNVPPGLTNVIAVAAGSYHLLALRDDGRVATWASFPVITGLTNVPANATNVMAIAAAGDNNMVLRSNGTVIVWGNNSFGQTSVPESASNIIAISAGGSHCLALRSNGTIIAWGNNSFGQATSPAGLSNVIAIAAGGAHNLALKTDGTIVAWGYNVSGQTNVPLSATNVIAIDAGGVGSLALRANGTAVSWGDPNVSIPSTLTNLVATSVGIPRNVALKADGSIASWVANQTPPSPALSNVIAIAAGERGTFGAAVIGNGSPFFTIQPASQITARSNTVKLHARAVGLQPIKYQWQLDNVNLPAATNADLTIVNAQGKDTGTYRCVAANLRGTNISARAQLIIPYSPALPAALNATNLTWTTNLFQTPPWFAQIRETHDGDVAAQSGAITNNQSSVLQTTVTGPGTLTFWWKVSSEQSYDFLRFYLNNLTTPFRSISGETDWEKITVTLSNALSYTLRWTYSKDISVNAGRDAGWLDEVIFTPNPPIIERQPFSQTVPLGATVTIPAIASSSTPMSYQWLKNGTNLANATAQYLTLTNVARRDSARYALRVFNAGGSVTSSNAILKVIVPQRLSGLRLLPDGSAELTSGDLDGAPLLALDLPMFEAQTSTNLKDWTVLHDALIVTNDVLRLRDANRSNYPIRFYRIVEH
jgi:hypothetical protein